MNKSNVSNQKICQYIDILFEYRKSVNVISKKITREDIDLLIKESIFLGERISSEMVVDAGSGNGILGIPIATIWSNKKIVLVETKKRKIEFLKYLIYELKMTNVELSEKDIRSYLKGQNNRKIALIARGFPQNELLIEYLYKDYVTEILLITSMVKVKNYLKPIENIVQNQYNIPWRDFLVLFSLKKVSRETQ